MDQTTTQTEDLVTAVATKGEVTHTLPSGRVLRILRQTLPHGERFVMSGGYWGRHDLEVSLTNAERLRFHWEGYVKASTDRERELTARPTLVGPGGYLRNQHTAECASGVCGGCRIPAAPVELPPVHPPMQLHAVQPTRTTTERLVAKRHERELAEVNALPKTYVLRGPGLSVSLKASEVKPNNPGDGTPAMVYVPFKGSATFWFARDMGMVHDRRGGECCLTPKQEAWLNSAHVGDCVEAFISGWTKRITKGS